MTVRATRVLLRLLQRCWQGLTKLSEKSRVCGKEEQNYIANDLKQESTRAVIEGRRLLLLFISRWLNQVSFDYYFLLPAHYLPTLDAATVEWLAGAKFNLNYCRPGVYFHLSSLAIW